MSIKINIVRFKKAIEDTSMYSRAILLGNGFSQSIWPKFSYRHLYEKSISTTEKWVQSPSDNLQRLFKKLDTYDFEKIISYLNNAITVINCYPAESSFKKTLLSDKDALINSFVHALEQVHPKFRQHIENISTPINKFLKHFSSIFTLNYDLLLYWLINYDGGEFSDLIEFPSITDKYDDGFTYDRNLGNIWTSQPKKDRQPQNTHYLHGSLFINNDNGMVFKTKYNPENNEGILHQLKNQLMNGKNPLIVLEGTSETKLRKIDNNGYLTHSLDSLKNIDGSIFTFGFSFNKHADQHIADAIQNSNVKSIYLGYYNKEDKEHFNKYVINHLSRKGSQKRDIFLFDVKDATDWKPVQDQTE